MDYFILFFFIFLPFNEARRKFFTQKIKIKQQKHNEIQTNNRSIKTTSTKVPGSAKALNSRVL